MTAVLLVLAGGLGAVVRHELALRVRPLGSRSGPVATAVVNLTGAALLGLLVGAHADGLVGGGALDVLGVGFLGGFTTFSTWMVDSLALATSAGARDRWAAAANLVLPLALGVAVAATTLAVGAS